MVEPPKRRALGRGLDALLPSMPTAAANMRTAAEGAAPAPGPASHGRSPDSFHAPIEELHPSSFQPRTHFDDEALSELAASLTSVGMLGPILVRRRAQGGYEIVAGERRWRAAQKAGLHDVPVVLRELSEVKAFEASLVENLQREDLNAIETARAYQRLIDEHDHGVESIAKLIGKDRSTISNVLRLLKLPEDIIERIAARELTEGHGRALLGASDVETMLRLAREAVAKQWSVRETERHTRAAARPVKSAEGEQSVKSANTRDLEERLGRRLGTRVVVADRRGKGHLSINFSSYDELDRLLEVLLGP